MPVVKWKVTEKISLFIKSAAEFTKSFASHQIGLDRLKRYPFRFRNEKQEKEDIKNVQCPDEQERVTHSQL